VKFCITESYGLPSPRVVAKSLGSSAKVWQISSRQPPSWVDIPDVARFGGLVRCYALSLLELKANSPAVVWAFSGSTSSTRILLMLPNRVVRFFECNAGEVSAFIEWESACRQLMKMTRSYSDAHANCISAIRSPDLPPWAQSSLTEHVGNAKAAMAVCDNLVQIYESKMRALLTSGWT
jgi:hypothetical protein